MKRRKKSSTPETIDLTIDSSSDEEDVVDLNIRRNSQKRPKIESSIFIDLTLEPSSENTQLKKANDMDSCRKPSPKRSKKKNGSVRRSVKKLGRDLFKTIYPIELEKYVGLYRVFWENLEIKERIKEVKKRTKGKLISTTHPLFECLEGNTMEKLKKIYSKHISNEIPLSMSKDGMICELIRKLYGLDTALESRKNESQILKETGSLEKAFQFITMSNHVIPNEIAKEVLSFLPRNYDVIVNIGSSCSVFYVLLLCTWDHVVVTSENSSSIPLTVLKSIRKITIHKITIPEIKYIFSHVSMNKLRTIRIEGLKFLFQINNSAFTQLQIAKESGDDHIVNVMNNIESIELPFNWFYFNPLLNLRGKCVYDLFPKVKVVNEVSEKLPLEIFRRVGIQELGMVFSKFTRTDFTTRCRDSNFDIHSVRKLTISGYLEKSKIKKMVYCLKNLEEVSILVGNSYKKQVRGREKLGFDVSLNIFNRQTLEKNGLQKLRKLCILQTKERDDKYFVHSNFDVSNSILHLEELRIEVDHRNNCGFELFCRYSFFNFLQVRKLKMIIPYKISKHSPLQKCLKKFKNLVCGDHQMLKGFEVFDLEILCDIDSSFRVRFDRKLGDHGLTTFRITLNRKNLLFGVLTHPKNVVLGKSDRKKEVPLNLIFEVLVVEIVRSLWMKRGILDYLEVDFGGPNNLKWFLREMKDWEGIGSFYYFEENTSENSCSLIRKSLL